MKPKRDFKKAASAEKINDYIITLVDGDDNMMTQQTRPFTFKRSLGDWVAAQTGVVPDVQIMQETVATNTPRMLIQCTESLIDKIQTQFAADIGDVEYVRKLSDIPPGERGCWKPRHGR